MHQFLVIEFSNGERWRVPIDIIQESRCRRCAEVDGITLDEARKQEAWCLTDSFELKDWAANNMEWEGLRLYAVHEKSPNGINYDAEFTNAKLELT